MPVDGGQNETRPISWKVLAAAVFVLGIVAFATSLPGEWIYDDRPLILQNPYAHGLRHWQRWFTHDFWDTGEEMKRFGSRLIYWRPAISASYAIDWTLGGKSPVLFHVTNLVWHGLASLLAFVALRRWIGAVWPAFIAAVLFAVHPTKAESVAWIAGRTDVFCTVAILITAEGIARRMRGEKYGLAIEIAGTVFAYMTKEQAIVLPAFAVVEAWVFLGRPALDLDSAKKLIRAGLPQLVLAVAYLALRTKVMPVKKVIGSSALRPSEYFGQIAESFGRYTTLAFVPHDLSVQQALIETKNGRLILTTQYVIIGAVSFAAFVALALYTRKRAPAVALGILIFMVTILPTSNVLPMGMLTMISERFLYLPSIGLALSVGWGFHLLMEHRAALVKPIAGILALAALTLTIISMRRSDDYIDQRRFWARELSLHPDSLEAWRFTIADAERAHKFAEALRGLVTATQIAADKYAHTGSEVDFIIQGSDLMALLTPDLDDKELAALDAFYDSMLKPGSQATLDIRLAKIRVTVSQAGVSGRIAALKPLILTGRALIASRRGDDAKAQQLVQAATQECPKCAIQLSRLSVVPARAGDYPSAYKALDDIAAYTNEDFVKEQRATIQKAELYGKQAAVAPEGPIQLQLRGLELSTLDAWGRAYAILRDYKEPIKKAPGFALGFAELAFRAGDTASAREVLEAVVPPEKVASTLTEWGDRMGWR